MVSLKTVRNSFFSALLGLAMVGLPVVCIGQQQGNDSSPDVLWQNELKEFVKEQRAFLKIANQELIGQAALLSDTTVASGVYRTIGKKGANYLKAYYASTSEVPFIRKDLKGLADTLELNSLEFLATSAARAKADTALYPSLMDLSSFYFDNRRKGDTSYILRIQRQLAQKGAVRSQTIFSLGGGLVASTGGVGLDAHVIMGNYMPRSSFQKTLGRANGILFGVEYYSRFLSTASRLDFMPVKIGFQTHFKQLSIGASMLLLFNEALDASSNINTGRQYVRMGNLYRIELGYSNDKMQYFAGALLPDYNSSLGAATVLMLQRNFPMLQFGVRYRWVNRKNPKFLIPTHQASYSVLEDLLIDYRRKR